MPIKMSRDWRMKKRTIRHESFDEDESITIRSYYGDNDRQRVLSAATEYRRDENTGQTTIIATLDKMHVVKREIAVVSWTLKDEDGFPLPFNRDVLMNLPTDISNWLDEEINADWGNLGEPAATREEAEQQDQQTKEDKATFLGPSIPSTERAEANGRANDGSGEGDSRRRGAEAAGT